MGRNEITVMNALPRSIVVYVANDPNALLVTKLGGGVGKDGINASMQRSEKPTVTTQMLGFNLSEKKHIPLTSGKAYVSVFVKSSKEFYYVLFLNRLLNNLDTFTVQENHFKSYLYKIACLPPA